MIIKFHRKFDKRYIKLDKKIKDKFKEKVLVFIENPFDSSLNNHILHGRYSDYRSIDIIGDWRALYKQNDNNVVFVFIGTHSELY